MSDKPKPAGLTPAQSIGFFCGALTTGLSFYALYSLRTIDLTATAAGAEETGVVMKAYHAIDLAAYFPDIFEGIKGHSLLCWVASYSVIPLLILFATVILTTWLLNVLFEKPQTSLLEDPEFEALHKGVKSPAINHLEPIMAVLPPRDRKTLLRDIAHGVINPITPRSTTSDIVDRPASLPEFDEKTMAIAIASQAKKR